MLMPLSAALPVVTFRVPVSDPAAISPTRPVTTSAAEPVRVSAVFCASAVGGHRHGIGVEAVSDRGGRRAGGDGNRIVGRIAGGHGQCAGQRTRRDIADQPAHHLGRDPVSVSTVLLARARCIDRHRIACAARADRGCRRAGGDR